MEQKELEKKINSESFLLSHTFLSRCIFNFLGRTISGGKQERSDKVNIQFLSLKIFFFNHFRSRSCSFKSRLPSTSSILFPHFIFSPKFYEIVVHMKRTVHPDADIHLSLTKRRVSYLSVVHLGVGDRQRSRRRCWGAVVLVVLLIQSRRLIMDVCTRISIVD